MPKSKNKIVCKVCKREISASSFANHIRGNQDHCDYYSKIVDKKNIANQYYMDAKCHCGKDVIFPKNLFNLVLQKDNGLEVDVYKKYCSHKCANHTVWNKGLTKNSHSSIAKIANDRKGDANPIHKILNDEKKKNEWKDAISKGRIEFDNFRRGKSMEKFLGLEKSKIAKNNMSISAKKRKIHGHTGKKHTEETKQKLREITAKRIANMQNFVSKPQRQLFEILKNNFNDEDICLEYFLRFYSFDICFSQHKILVELDGDFWHVNEKKGFLCKHDYQKRNLSNDKRKNAFVKTIGWTLFRIWESDLEEQKKVDKLIDKIGKIINEK